jgi:hypothetical protein
VRIQNLLKRALVAFDNALASPEIMTRLAEFGYDEARLQRCRDRVEGLEQLYHSQRSLHSDKVAATAAYRKARHKADRHHHRLIKQARILADEMPGLSHVLRLSSADSSNAFSNWRSRQNQFYTELESDTELATQLLEFGVTTEKLAAGREAYNLTMTAYKDRERLNGLANQATEDRNAAEAEVKDCLDLFLATARRALADNHDWLITLGLA